MPKYVPLASVMPVASMVTDATVSSALCDQMNDNLAALYEGVWFRANGSAQTVPTSATTLIPMTSIVISDTATDTGCVEIVGGQVQTTLAGQWRIGGAFALSSGIAGFVDLLVDSTDSPVFAAEHVNDTTTSTNKTDFCTSGDVEVTSAINLFGMYAFIVGGAALAVDSRSPVLWGVFLGEA